MHNVLSPLNNPFRSLYDQNVYQSDMIASPSMTNNYNPYYKDSHTETEEQHNSPAHAYHHHSSDYEYDYNIRSRHPKGNQDHIQHGHTKLLSTHKHRKLKHNKRSVITALTLLSFLFFINLLQNCLKENMLTLNPTVMIMTARISRNAKMIETLKDSKRKHRTQLDFVASGRKCKFGVK